MPALKSTKETHLSHSTQFTFITDFDSHGKSLIRRKRRCFTEAEKQHMDKVRKAGACPHCRRRKIKCTHALSAKSIVSDIPTSVTVSKKERPKLSSSTSVDGITNENFQRIQGAATRNIASRCNIPRPDQWLGHLENIVSSTDYEHQIIEVQERSKHYTHCPPSVNYLSIVSKAHYALPIIEVPGTDIFNMMYQTALEPPEMLYCSSCPTSLNTTRNDIELAPTRVVYPDESQHILNESPSSISLPTEVFAGTYVAPYTNYQSSGGTDSWYLMNEFWKPDIAPAPPVELTWIQSPAAPADNFNYYERNANELDKMASGNDESDNR